jgi:hypothetical protein
LWDQALGMDPAQRMAADVELTGVVADDDGVGEEAVIKDAAPQRALGGDAHRIGSDHEPAEAETIEVGRPGGVVGEASGLAGLEPGDQRPGEVALAHVGEPGGAFTVITRSSVIATPLAPRCRRVLAFPPAGPGSVAGSMPLGRIFGRPFRPLRRAISLPCAAFSALNAEISSRSCKTSFLNSSTLS